MKYLKFIQFFRLETFAELVTVNNKRLTASWDILKNENK